MFVGDSVQRSQFESLVCLVESVIPQGMKSLERIPPRKVFKIKVTWHSRIVNNSNKYLSVTENLFLLLRNLMLQLSIIGLRL